MSTASNRAVGLRRSVLDSPSRKKSGKGWRGSYRDRLDIPKGEETDILLTRAEYPNPNDIDEKTGEPRLAHYHTCKMHGFKLKDKGPGSYFTARCNMDAGQPDCVACMRQEQGDRRVGLKDDFSFNCLHLAVYEKVELVRDGKVVKYEEGDNRGKPMLVWEQVEKPKRLAQLLENIDNELESGEVALFRKRYLEVGAGHRDELSLIDDMASKICKCSGELSPVAFTCEDCEELLADVGEDDMSKKEVAAFASSREKCKKCGHVGLPVPVTTCDSCKQPSPLSAFDVVATVRKEGEGTNSHITVKKITPIDVYEMPNGASLIEWENVAKKGEKAVYEPKFTDDDQFIYTEDFDVKKNVEAQWNFELVHEPRDHGFIAHKLACENPFKGSGTDKSKYRSYGKDGSRTRVTEDDKADEQPEPRRGGRAAREEAPERRRRVVR